MSHFSPYANFNYPYLKIGLYHPGSQICWSASQMFSWLNPQETTLPTQHYKKTELFADSLFIKFSILL